MTEIQNDYEDESTEFLLTTKEVAEEIGISAQSVRNCFKAIGIEPIKRRNKYLITPEQANEVCIYFDIEPKFSKAKSNDIKADESIMYLLEKQMEKQAELLETLKEQLRQKDNQISELSKKLDDLIEANKALSASNAISTAADKKEILISETSKDKKKKSIWQRLFNND